MGDEFRALQRRLGITTLYVTHDQEEAMALSDRVVVMQRGRILQVGAPETSIAGRPAARSPAFFGTPNLHRGDGDGMPADGDATTVLDDRGRARTRRLPRRPGVPAPATPSWSWCGPRTSRLAASRHSRGNERQLAWPGKVVDGVLPRAAPLAQPSRPRACASMSNARRRAPAAVGETVTLLVDADNAWALRP